MQVYVETLLLSLGPLQFGNKGMLAESLRYFSCIIRVKFVRIPRFSLEAVEETCVSNCRCLAWDLLCFYKVTSGC